ncbi:MAG: DUF4251 domain-containing protein [Rikenellaceae bacterium]
MKKIFIFTMLLMFVCVVGYGVLGSRSKPVSPKSERREIREQRRAERQAQFEKTIDSLVLSHNFQFVPQTMQQMISGGMRPLSNPSFEVGIWDNAADIFLPYVKGFAPPFHFTIINATVNELQNYLSEQTSEGWRVSFETNLYSASVYTFIFEINSRYGGVNLTLKNQWYDPVEYTGTITQY